MASPHLVGLVAVSEMVLLGFGGSDSGGDFRLGSGATVGAGPSARCGAGRLLGRRGGRLG